MTDIVDLPEDEEDEVLPMAEYIEDVKQRIVEDEYKREFTTDHIIESSGFVDFLFIGEHNGEPVVWNACITTGKGDYYETVDSKSTDEGYEKYPSKYEPFGDESWVPFVTKDHPKEEGLTEWIDPEPELSGKRMLWIAERTMELLANESIKQQFWDVEIDESYKWGIGLHIRVDVDRIELDDVSNFITLFNEKGLDAFEDKDLSVRSMTADELGVELREGCKFVTWKDLGNRNIAALNLGIDDES